MSTFFTVTDLSAQESLVERLKSLPIESLATEATKFGNPRRGAIAFYQPTMNCARCHEQQQGRRLGPDLAEKRDVKVAHLIDSILSPSATIKEGFETVSILLEDGKQITGVLASETDTTLTVDQIEQPELPLVVDKEEIDQWKKTTLSSMPEDLANQLADQQQFLDLVSYLFEISKGGKLKADELRPTGLAAITPLPEYESRVDHAGLIRSLNEKSLTRGSEIYRLRCASCHGTVTEEGSMPTSLRFANGKFKNGNDPYRMYQTLTHGYGMMNPQRWMVPQQKYDVIHYIREHFVKPNNPDQFYAVKQDFLTSLPVGDTRGPKPVVSQPWTAMDYGPSFINTIEVSRDGSNIAQKGIAVRLDDGPGGVESGKYWMMYEHDTMRLAAAWSGGFIDYEGIHFNGTHGRHPSVAGEIHLKNPTGPGWGRPEDGSFEDNRLVGRDDKHYGPLDRDWAQYQGMYRFGRQTIIKYTVGETEILESPSLTFVDDQPVFQRAINLGQRDKELVLQVANVEGSRLVNLQSDRSVMLLTGSESDAVENSDNVSKPETTGIELDGATFAEVTNGGAFDMSESDFSIAARIRTTRDGTLFAQTKSQDEWVPQGKSLFIRNGRLAYDIGWVGAVNSRRRIDDGKWHDIVMTWREKDGQACFYVDGNRYGRDEIEPEDALEDSVVRIGFTNDNFPSEPFFDGSIAELTFYQRLLTADEIAGDEPRDDEGLLAKWDRQSGTELVEQTGKNLTAIVSQSTRRREESQNLLASVASDQANIVAKWELKDGNLRLRIPAGAPVNLLVSQAPTKNMASAAAISPQLERDARPVDLSALTKGGPANWPEKLTTELIKGETSESTGPFAVDVFKRPTKNPWNAQLRLTGLDFLPDGNTLVASAWDGSVWRVSGFKESGNAESQLTWQRIAAGLFQPLGIKWIDNKVYVTCRDQLVVLHDLNGNGEADWYECLNSDHQVTEHFHEFAMGLQTDNDGNFYYAKSARHAKTAVVPHHGTLLKISPDGERTEILATGFRAANGVCINPDGSFLVTDQEGHWNPKNRINWVRPGQFYGNMFGYHDVTDNSNEAMEDPLCWITNAFDRSPSELLWVDSEKWGPLNGSLLNFSYGYGEVHIVPHEEVDGKMQGGLCALPMDRFPTGVMRGRFHKDDGQLYCCGMFAWAGAQHQPGGLYRVRYTGQPVHLPIGLQATADGIEVKLSGDVDSNSAADVSNYSITVWDLKRTANYGSAHYNEQKLEVTAAKLLADNKTIRLSIPELKPTWGMEIKYSLESTEGKRVTGKIHNSIFKMGK